MKTVKVTDFGMIADGKTPCAAALEKMFASVGDDCTVLFPGGVYYLEKRVKVSGHKNLTLKGENATLRVHFCNSCTDGLDGAFVFENCRNLTLKLLAFDTDVPPNMSGTVTALNREEGWFEFTAFDEFEVHGNEILNGMNSMDSELTADYRISTYAPCKYEYLGNRTFRIRGEDVSNKLQAFYEGMVINVRHMIYGPQLITFADVDGALIEDVDIFAAPGLVYVVRPRCKDFTFNRCSIRLPKGTKRVMSSNADGIHILGLAGKLIIKDSLFECLGDDALNIHSIAGMVSEVRDGRLTCLNGRTGKPLDKAWAAAGDILYVYDGESFVKTGELKVISYSGTEVQYELLSGAVSDGNVLANSAFYAATEVTGCTIRNTAARALLCQTHNILVENCRMYGFSGRAIMLAPDVVEWFEVGPCDDVVIKNNVIEKCNYSVRYNASNWGAIAIKCTHNAGLTDSPAGVHNRIKITGNTFREVGASAVCALGVKDIEITGNRFQNCGVAPFDKKIEMLQYDVALINCDNAKVADNPSNRDGKYALYLDNVTGLK